MHFLKHIFQKHTAAIFGLLFLLVFGTFLRTYATPPTTPFSAGETINPSCAPGAINCTVAPVNIGSGISSGTSGSVLFVDSSTQIGQDNSNLFFDNTNNRLGIGTASPAGLFHISSDTVDIGTSYFTQANASSDSFDFNFRKARGTGGTPTVITTADELGVINFTGYGGAAGYITGASIKGISSGTIADSRVPGFLSFWTSTDAQPSVSTERLRITNDGSVGIGTTTPGAKLEISGTSGSPASALKITNLPTSAPSGFNGGIICVDNSNNLWSDNDGTEDCI